MSQFEQCAPWRREDVAWRLCILALPSAVDRTQGPGLWDSGTPGPGCSGQVLSVSCSLTAAFCFLV